RAPDSRRRTGEGITIAGDIIKVAVEVTLQNVDDVVSGRASAVVTLIDDRAFLILLRKVITIETRVAGLAGVRQIYIGKLAIGKFFNQPTIRFNPRARAQSLFSCYRNHNHMRSEERRVGKECRSRGSR